MMEPRIQYAKTSDGVSIAFWTLGDGIPIVRTPPLGFSHLQLEWQNTPQRSMCNGVCSRRGAQEMSTAPPRADTGEVGLNVQRGPRTAVRSAVAGGRVMEPRIQYAQMKDGVS